MYEEEGVIDGESVQFSAFVEERKEEKIGESTEAFLFGLRSKKLYLILN